MRDRLDIADYTILAIARANYAIDLERFTFLPIGNDSGQIVELAGKVVRELG